MADEKWVSPNVDEKTSEFKRQVSQFRDNVSNTPGSKFPAEKDRYHLYVSYACPWAHRTLIVRKLKGLESILPYTAVHWHLGSKGWRFATKFDTGVYDEAKHVTEDPLHPNFTHLREIYFESDPDYKDRFTVPVLYDKIQKRIVNNESSDIITMLYTAFDDLLPTEKQEKSMQLLPSSLKPKIEEANEWIYHGINNGVYKTGFATTQEAYDSNVKPVFAALDRAEKHLALQNSQGPYFWGKSLTDTDIRLYTTIVRFDPVYVQHFKCNIRDIRSGYSLIHAWLRNLYWKNEAFNQTTEFEHIKFLYTKSVGQINPFGITPAGPMPHIMELDEEVAAVEEFMKREKECS
ncbi:hypothetical protein K470DRAFT_241560 [Piedraia hortae CBS 480.64]|uniref:GST N-terminal domain-containing protein n=1 Tax=Piedraia hortae CBS 480.64 TaxID=1314780 RepID=A0A6A7C7N3_9PEZI|nr:hypothetical protein K470DRAFT_241560 [Piedraia hortae CBS 480.64]